MPRHVDHEARRAAITDAVLDLVADGGTAAVNFRAIAKRLGGSTTMVTHYYRTQQELINDVAQRSAEGWHVELAQLEGKATTSAERLAILLVWLLPTSRDGLRDERARINLLSSQIVGRGHRPAFTAWDETVRSILREHVKQLVAGDRVDAVVETLRITTNGIVLSVVERHHKWTRQHQLGALQSVVDVLDIGDADNRVRLVD